MDKTKLFFSIDCFCPKPYFDLPNEELFFVFQVFLFKNDPGSDIPALIDNIQAGNIVWARLMEGDVTDSNQLILLPPPAPVSLQLSYNSQPAIGNNGFNFPSMDAKIDWIKNNYSFLTITPLKDYPGYLSDDQLKQLKDWFIGQATLYFDTTDVSTEAQNIRKYFRNLGGINTTLKDVVTQIGKADRTDGGFKVMKDYLELGLSDSKNFPADFKFTIEALDKLKINARDSDNLVGGENNFRTILYQAVKNEIKQRASEPAAEVLKERMNFYFGMGERLRIELPTGLPAMTVIDEDEQNKNGRVRDNVSLLVTNNYTLCGMIFSIPLSGLTDTSTVKLDIRNAGGATLFTADLSDLSDSIRFFKQTAGAVKADNFKMDVSLQDDPVQGNTVTADSVLANYLPKSLLLKKSGKTLQNAGKTFDWYYVGQALLDALSPIARAMPGANGKFLEINNQRMFIKGNEVFKNDADLSQFPDLDVFGYVRGIGLDVTIQQTFLPHRSDFICKLFKNADTGQEAERAALFNILKATGSPAGAESPDRDILFFLRANGQSDFTPVSVFYKTDAPATIGWDENELLECYLESQVIDFSKGPVQAELLLVSAVQLADPTTAAAKNDKFFAFGFNSLLAINGKEEKFLALDNVYELTFNRSVEALKSIIKLRLFTDGYTPPTPVTGTAVDPLLVDFSNFKKLRLYLKPATDKNLLLNNSDALVPFTEVIRAPLQTALDMDCFYQMTHTFESEVSGENKDTKEQAVDIKAEENLYNLYRSPVRDFILQGKGENQYAFRKLSGEKSISLPYARPLKNPADASIHQTTGDAVNFQGMLEYRFSIDAAGRQHHQLMFNRTYFEMAKASKEDGPTDVNNPKKVARYRQLYQLMLDAFNSDLSIVVETWTFNNLSQVVHPLQPDEAGHPEKSDQHPAMMNYLEPDKNVIPPRKLTAAEKNDLFANLTDKPSFETFRTFLDTYDFSRNVIDLKLADAGTAEFTVRRVGFRIDRAERHTIRFYFPEGKPIDEKVFLPVEPGKDDQGHQESNLKYERLAKARDFLAQYLKPNDDNPLYHKTAHLVSSEHRDSQRKYFPNVFGETRPYALICPQDPTPRTNKLYYIPYGFQPLQTPADYDNSGNNYTDFIEYVVRVMDYLSYPEFTTGDVTGLLIDIVDETDKRKLFRNKNVVRQLIGTLANRLSSLVVHVDNRPVSSPDQDYEKVIRMTSQDPQLPDTIQSMVGSILRANPVTYVDCKAMGIGLFDECQKDLYLMEIRKIIAADATDQHRQEERSSVNFKGFFQTGKNIVFGEVLQNAIYDNEFEIKDQSPDVLAAKGKIAADIVNGDLYTARISIPHFCPDWRLPLATGTRNYYLLPSRKPPVVPVPFTPDVHLIKRTFEERSVEWKRLVTNKTAGTLMVQIGSKDVPFQAKKELAPALIKLDTEVFSENDQFLSTYDFLVQMDEELEIGNDTYEIEVQENTESAASDSGAALPPSSFRAKYDLQSQFDRFVLKKQGSAQITWGKILSEAKEIIDKIAPQSENEKVGTNPVYTLFFSGADDSLKVNLRLGSQTSVSLAPHRMISAELFEAVNAVDSRLLLVRLKVFCNPWTKCRVRLRVRRNLRDLGGDNRFDINPALVMNSPWSSWIDYKWQLLTYDYLETLKVQLDSEQGSPLLPKELRRLVAQGVSYTDYRQKVRQGAPVKLGNQMVSARSLSVARDLEGRKFVCRVYELSAANGINLYTDAKKDKSIIEEHIEKINFNGKAWVEGSDLSVLDNLPANIVSYEPVYDITWYSNKDGVVPVFMVKLKLELSR